MQKEAAYCLPYTQCVHIKKRKDMAQALLLQIMRTLHRIYGSIRMESLPE